MNGTEWDTLRLSLHTAIRAWSECVSEDPGTQAAVGCWTDEIMAYMAAAAIHTLKVSADKENWLREQGYVKD